MNVLVRGRAPFRGAASSSLSRSAHAPWWCSATKCCAPIVFVILFLSAAYFNYGIFVKGSTSTTTTTTPSSSSSTQTTTAEAARLAAGIATVDDAHAVPTDCEGKLAAARGSALTLQQQVETLEDEKTSLEEQVDTLTTSLEEAKAERVRLMSARQAAELERNQMLNMFSQAGGGGRGGSKGDTTKGGGVVGGNFPPMPPGGGGGGFPPFQLPKDFKPPPGFQMPQGFDPASVGLTMPPGMPTGPFGGGNGNNNNQGPPQPNAGGGGSDGDAAAAWASYQAALAGGNAAASSTNNDGGADHSEEDHVRDRAAIMAKVPPRAPLSPYVLTADQTSYYARIIPGQVAPVDASIEAAPKATRNARALLIICYNRPDYLRRTLQAVYDRLPSFNRPHIYVSQDGEVGTVTAVIQEFAGKFAVGKNKDIPFTHLKHPAGPLSLRGDPVAAWATGYYKLSQHFGWAFAKLFNELNHPRVIILEDDLEIAVDFFDFFSAVEPLLDTDETLLGASAWSDIGQSKFVEDPRQIQRSDFFPGLGWMLTHHAWEELGPKWPEAFWDDWLREPPQRKARQFLRPEISRSFTFGESGVSQSQFFADFLATIQLNDIAVDWTSEDTSYLDAAQWASDLELVLGRATKMNDIQSFISHVCGVGTDGSTQQGDTNTVVTPQEVIPGQSIDPKGADDLVFFYEGTHGYMDVAHAFHFIDDIKAGVPRSAYKGVVTLKHQGCRKFIAPSTKLDINNALPH